VRGRTSNTDGKKGAIGEYPATDGKGQPSTTEVVDAFCNNKGGVRREEPVLTSFLPQVFATSKGGFVTKNLKKKDEERAGLAVYKNAK